MGQSPPLRKVAVGESPRSSAAGVKATPLRKSETPIQATYSVPTQSRVLNAEGKTSSTTAMPVAPTATWHAPPATVPATADRPAPQTYRVPPLGQFSQCVLGG